MNDFIRTGILTYFTYFENLLLRYLPVILGSILILTFGWIVAKIVRLLVLRLFSGIDYLAQARGIEFSHPQKHKTSSTIIADGIFWLLIILALIFAGQNLGMQLLVHVLNYLPKVVLACIIIFIGYIFGNMAFTISINHLESLDSYKQSLVASFFKWVIIAFFIVLGVDQLDINISLLSNLIIITFGLLLAGTTLSFALAITDILKNMLAISQIRTLFEIGRDINVDETHGKLIEFTPTHVILETDQGHVHIPGQYFQTNISKLKVGFE